MSCRPIGGRLSARVGCGRVRRRCRGGDRARGRRWDRCSGSWSDDAGVADVRSRGLTVGAGRYEPEDDEADAGYARRCECADGLGYAYGLMGSAMGGQGDSWALCRDARGGRDLCHIACGLFASQVFPGQRGQPHIHSPTLGRVVRRLHDPPALGAGHGFLRGSGRSLVHLRCLRSTRATGQFARPRIASPFRAPTIPACGWNVRSSTVDRSCGHRRWPRHRSETRRQRRQVRRKQRCRLATRLCGSSARTRGREA